MSENENNHDRTEEGQPRPASHWTKLTEVGDRMTELGSHMTQLGSQHSKPQRHDLAEMLQLTSQMMHVGSLFLQESSPSDAVAMPAQEGAIPSKRARFLDSDSLACSPFVVTSLRSTPSPHVGVALSRSGATPAVTPSSSNEKEASDSNALFALGLDGDDEMTTNLWNDFSELFDVSQSGNDAAVSPAAVAATSGTDGHGAHCEEMGLLYNDFAVNGTPVKNDDPSRERGAREVKYLTKHVANTDPKVTLATFLRATDKNLVCLCGRGGHNHHHTGNQNYLDLIKARLGAYQSFSKKGKEEFTHSLVREFEKQGRRFFRVNRNDEWEEMDGSSIRAKISQSFRDA